MNEKIKAKISLIFVNLLFASCFLVTNALLKIFPMYLLTALRFIVAAICVAIVFSREVKKVNKMTILCGIGIGIVYSFGVILQTIGLKVSGAPGRTSFLTTFYCLLVPFFEWGVLRSKPSISKFVAAIIGIVGVGFVVLNEKFSINVGDLFTLIATILFAVYILLVNMYANKINIEYFNVFLFLTMGVVSLVMSLLFEGPPSEFSFSPIFGILYLAIFCAAIPLLIQSKAQRIVEPSFVAIMVGPQAMFTTIFSVIFFHEQITTFGFIGFILILISVIVGSK